MPGANTERDYYTPSVTCLEDFEADGPRLLPVNNDEVEIIVEVDKGLVQIVHSNQRLHFVEVLDRDIEREGAEPEEEQWFRQLEQKTKTMPFKY